MRWPEPVADLSFQQTTFLLPRASPFARMGYVPEIPPPSRLPSQVLCPGSSWLVPWQRELHGSLLSTPHTQEETEGQQRLLQLHEEGES